MIRLLSFLLFGIVLPVWSATLRPAGLRCEYLQNPLGIDVRAPRLTWVLQPVSPAARGVRQSAYRILASSTPEKLQANQGDVWDSGKTSSEQSVHVVYAGKPLTSGQRVYWKVQAWDEAGQPSEWSPAAHWSMGLLESSDWQAQWIGKDEPAPLRNPSSVYRALETAQWIGGGTYYRATLHLMADRGIRTVMAIAAADNSYELSINGTRAGKGNTLNAPDVFDVRGLVRLGPNEVRIRASNSRAGRPVAVIAAVRVSYIDGGEEMLVTGPRWETAAKPDGSWQAAKALGPYGVEPWGPVGFSEERYLPARLLRKEFSVNGAVKRATVYMSGLGLSELYLNGRKVGDHVLSPGLTDYDKRVFYVTHDVTALVKQGVNAIGALLGNGRYWAPRTAVPVPMRNFGYPKLLLRMEVELASGARHVVVSDATWQLTTAGPIAGNNEFDGEQYDARRELKGWSEAGFSSSQWHPASVVSAPTGTLVAPMAEPLRVTDTVRPVKITEPRPGVFVFDMGQNMVGWCRLRVSGKAGTRITLQHAETLRPDGWLYLDNLRSAQARDEYVLKGEGLEVWEPRFTYHGFRYVAIEGYPGKPPLTALEGRVVHDAMDSTADFLSSNPTLNQLHHNIYWGVRGNYRSIPTDCPQRDERMGWLGDRSVVSRGESYLFDIGAFYAKWMQDLSDSQRPTGSIPDVSPNYWTMYNDNITWPSTYLMVPKMLYDQYGDRRVIERHYPGMKKWVDYMRTFIKDGLMPKDTYGDWCVPPEKPELIHSQDPARRTDKTLLGTAYFIQMLRLISGYARLVDRPADAADYDTLAASMREAFERKFYQAAKAQYDNGTQTSGILPLALGITPQQNRAAVFETLTRKIVSETNGHVGTGLVGAQWLMRTLSDNGRPDLAYAMVTSKDYPGWGYMISKGATTIWELWNGDTADPAMNSGNHVMQIGDLNVWLYEYLGGIRPDPKDPGFHHILIKPVMPEGLTSVKASHRSLYGVIRTHWRREPGSTILDVTIPANTSATVALRASKPEAVTESGLAAAKAKGVQFAGMDNDTMLFEVGSGSYSFRVRD